MSVSGARTAAANTHGAAIGSLAGWAVRRVRPPGLATDSQPWNAMAPAIAAVPTTSGSGGAVPVVASAPSAGLSTKMPT